MVRTAPSNSACHRFESDYLHMENNEIYVSDDIRLARDYVEGKAQWREAMDRVARWMVDKDRSVDKPSRV